MGLVEHGGADRWSAGAVTSRLRAQFIQDSHDLLLFSLGQWPDVSSWEENYVRAVRRGRSRLLAAVWSPGYLRARYQCDAKSGDVIEKPGALAHDAHGASNDGISKRSVQRGIWLPRRRLFVCDSHGPFPSGGRSMS